MDENLSVDIELSHGALNYLRACYQGSFASLNILSQLGYRDFNPDELTACEHKLSHVGTLYSKLGSGIPVFSRSWKTPQTAESKEVLTLLVAMRNELLFIANKVEKILMEANFHENPENIKFLIASYARHAYTQENYIQGFVEYGKNFTLPNVVRTYEPLLPESRRNLEGAHLFFDIFTGEEPPSPIFYKSLVEEAIFLPGVYRSNAHDLLKCSIIYKGPLNFEMMEMPLEEAEEWAAIKVNPDLAGYWRSFRFRAQDMVDWVTVGVAAPRVAWFWRCMEFDAAVAAEWLKFGFSPLVAREWAGNRFTAEEAVDHIRRGFSNPATAREEGKKITDE